MSNRGNKLSLAGKDINITQWKRWELPETGLIFLPGISGGGKTHLIKYFIHERAKKGNIAWCFVFSSTIFNSSYDFVGDEWRSDEWTDELVEELLSMQERAVQRNKQLAKEGKKQKCINGVLILDDSLGLPGLNWQGKLMMKLLSCYRHWKLCVIITSQHPNKIPTLLRMNSDYIIAFRMSHMIALKSLFESMNSMTVSKESDFINLFQWVTGVKYRCLIFKKDVENNNFYEQYTMFKAPQQIEDFLLSV